MNGEIGVDLFAGGGGWSEGFAWATGAAPAIAVNHDDEDVRRVTITVEPEEPKRPS